MLVSNPKTFFITPEILAIEIRIVFILSLQVYTTVFLTFSITRLTYHRDITFAALASEVIFQLHCTIKKGYTK